MRILIIGGTRFIGRHIAATALAAGHEVTLLHRGRTGGDLFDGAARHLLADRDDPDALAATLADGEWDATIDICAYLPGQVTTLADALGARGGRYVLISTASVYDPEGPGFTEDSRLHELEGPTPTDVSEVTYANYGALKVLCERVASDRFGDAILVLRPSYVIGPWDHFGHVDYWAHRIARGGQILAPGAPGTPLQVIDARDIAEFTVTALAEGRSGTLHLVGASATSTYADFLDEVRAGIGVAESTVTWVDDAFLLAEGETVASLPMWAQGDRAEELTSAADPAASLRAGLRLRPVAESAREALATGAPSKKALTAEREAELLARWHAR
ncbi:isoflavone reductase [Longispora fulva]|uniref:2'-hydroxyisoflavone reductase n=1 Tax=Longispora fulva TaxID=619741 RepID=A0A8J7GCY4_9ACTN|nr:NAD-dependent epimerase/dehydratase family protein [Longispora fulva]MBG6135740.1 2'-hydroxyisoflavone reductase [Longispora fulva]GIG56020.1 isoflavone reductase [Longispora fulva]